MGRLHVTRALLVMNCPECENVADRGVERGQAGDGGGPAGAAGERVAKG